jgi:hypothetical protein
MLQFFLRSDFIQRTVKINEPWHITLLFNDLTNMLVVFPQPFHPHFEMNAAQ